MKLHKLTPKQIADLKPTDCIFLGKKASLEQIKGLPALKCALVLGHCSAEQIAAIPPAICLFQPTESTSEKVITLLSQRPGTTFCLVSDIRPKQIAAMKGAQVYIRENLEDHNLKQIKLNIDAAQISMSVKLDEDTKVLLGHKLGIDSPEEKKLKTEIADLKNQLSRLQKEKNLQEKLTDDAKREYLRRETEYKERITALEHDADRLRKATRLDESDHKEYIARHNAQLDRADMAIDNLKIENANLYEGIGSLREQVENLHFQLEEITNLNAIYQPQIEMLKKRLKDTAAETEKSDSNNDVLSALTTRQAKLLQELNEKLQSSQLEETNLRQKISDLDKQLREAVAIQERLVNQVSNEMGRSISVNKVNSELKIRLQEIEADLKRKETEIRSFLNTTNDQRCEIDRLAEQLQELNRQRGILQSQLETASQKTAPKRKLEQELKETRAALAQEQAEKKVRGEQLEKQKVLEGTQKRKIDELEKQRSEQDIEITRLRDLLQEAGKMNENLKRQRREVTAQPYVMPAPPAAAAPGDQRQSSTPQIVQFLNSQLNVQRQAQEELRKKTAEDQKTIKDLKADNHKLLHDKTYGEQDARTERYKLNREIKKLQSEIDAMRQHNPEKDNPDRLALNK